MILINEVVETIICQFVLDYHFSIEKFGFKTLRVLKTNLRFRVHREFPNNYKLSSITISKDSIGYYVSFTIEFKKQIDLVVSKDNLDISKSIGIDLNAYNFAVSSNVNFIQDSNISTVKLNHLIDNGATNRKG